MLLTIEKVLILKSVKIFSSVPEAQLADLATITESVEYSAGDTILKQGEPAVLNRSLSPGQRTSVEQSLDQGAIRHRVAIQGRLSHKDMGSPKGKHPHRAKLFRTRHKPKHFRQLLNLKVKLFIAVN